MGGLVTRSKCSARHAWRSFAGVPRGVMNALTRILVSRTALGTQFPTAATGRSCVFHGLSGIAQALTSRHSFVLGPHPIKDSKELVSFFSQRLVPIERHHGRHGLALFLDDDGVFFPANPPKQSGELVLGVFGAEGLHHGVSSLVGVLRESVHRVRTRVQGKFVQGRNRRQEPLCNVTGASRERHMRRPLHLMSVDGIAHVFNRANVRRAIGIMYDSLEHVSGLNDARNEWRIRP